MKIQSRLDYFFVPKFLQKLIQECRIIPNTFSDHSALILTIRFNEETANSIELSGTLLAPTLSTALSMPSILEIYLFLNDKGLYL